jgi:hypothetical protein
MHGPYLLSRILAVKYRIDTTKSEDCESLFQELDELMSQLQCATKWPEERIKKVILLRYIQYAAEQAARLEDSPKQMSLTERPEGPAETNPSI